MDIQHQSNNLKNPTQNKIKIRNFNHVYTIKKNGCQICGYNDDVENIHFHHIDPSTKFLEVGNLVAWRYSLKAIDEEIEKCAILCSSCHSKVHAGKIKL